MKKIENDKTKELILNAAGEGLTSVDLEGNITYVNPAAARMIGWKVEELIGQTAHNVMHHSKPDGIPYPAEDCPIHAVIRDGLIHKQDSEVFWRKDGTSFPVEYTISPIREDDKLVGTVLVFRDISERKDLEEELYKANRALKALSQCTQTVIQTTEQSDLLNEICRIIVEVGEYRLAWVGFAGNEEKFTPYSAGWIRGAIP